MCVTTSVDAGFRADKKQLVVTTIRDYLNKLARNSAAPTIPAPSGNDHPVCPVPRVRVDLCVNLTIPSDEGMDRPGAARPSKRADQVFCVRGGPTVNSIRILGKF